MDTRTLVETYLVNAAEIKAEEANVREAQRRLDTARNVRPALVEQLGKLVGQNIPEKSFLMRREGERPRVLTVTLVGDSVSVSVREPETV